VKESITLRTIDRKPSFFLEISERVPSNPWMNSTIVSALLSSGHSIISLPSASITAAQMVLCNVTFMLL
jgi:hypothetical protein